MSERDRRNSRNDSGYHELRAPLATDPAAAAAALATAPNSGSLTATLSDLKNMSRPRFVTIVLLSVLILIVLATANLGTILKDHNVFERLADKMLRPKSGNSTDNRQPN